MAALTNQEQRFITRAREDAMTLLNMRDELTRLVALYNAKGFGASILDADFAETPNFDQYTQSDVWNVVTAFNSVLDALGDNVSGEAVNLIKFQG